jgi:hypothetical protein
MRKRGAHFFWYGLYAEPAATSRCNLVGDIKSETQSLAVLLHRTAIKRR